MKCNYAPWGLEKNSQKKLKNTIPKQVIKHQNINIMEKKIQKNQ